VTIWIGTSGWHYPHWQGTFYPESLPKTAWLSDYAHRFDTVEINHSFYQLPSQQTLKQWRETVPDRFQFTAKASGYITHRKKLKDPEQTLVQFFDRIRVLEDKLAVILFQLPPRWSPNFDRLANFIEALPPEYRYAFEFRDRRWFAPKMYEILSRSGVALCLYELAGARSPQELTTDWTYIRLHGMHEDAYRGRYDAETLDLWAKQLLKWSEMGHDIYCYFDNDEAGYAPQDALALRERIGGNVGI
jgi:uncharacterized protein YecE (DUF72 family)